MCTLHNLSIVHSASYLLRLLFLYRVIYVYFVVRSLIANYVVNVFFIWRTASSSLLSSSSSLHWSVKGLTIQTSTIRATSFIVCSHRIMIRVEFARRILTISHKTSRYTKARQSKPNQKSKSLVAKVSVPISCVAFCS